METLLANACSYLGMTIALAGVKAKRETQKWCYLIGPLLLLVGAYLFGNTVFILLQAVIVVAGFGGILDLKPTLLAWPTLLSAAIALAALWQGGFVELNWSITGPVGLVLVTLGVALAPRPVSNLLYFIHWANCHAGLWVVPKPLSYECFILLPCGPVAVFAGSLGSKSRVVKVRSFLLQGQPYARFSRLSS